MFAPLFGALPLLVASSANAQSTPQSSANDFPHFQTNVAFDAHWLSTQFGSAFAFDPMIEGRLGERLSLSGHLPIGITTDATHAGPGNPTLTLQALLLREERTRLYVGGLLNFPLVRIGDDRDLYAAAAGAATAEAFQHMPYWAGAHLAVGGIAGIEHRLDAPLFLRAQFDPTFFIPLRRDADPEFGLRTKFEFEGRAASGLGGGLALNGILSSGGGDNFQSSAEGFFSYFGASAFFRLGVLLALDRPLGFGFDDGRVLSAHASFGIPFK